MKTLILVLFGMLSAQGFATEPSPEDLPFARCNYFSSAGIETFEFFTVLGQLSNNGYVRIRIMTSDGSANSEFTVPAKVGFGGWTQYLALFTVDGKESRIRFSSDLSPSHGQLYRGGSNKPLEVVCELRNFRSEP